MTVPMNVLLATPVANEVSTAYASSLAKLMDDCARTRPEIRIDVRFLASPLVHRARNVFANLALAEGFTHLLFIDADIGYLPSAIYRMLDSGHDVCGCVYPAKILDDAAFHQASRRVDDPLSARLLATSFVGQEKFLQTDKDGRKGFEVRNGFVRTRAVGMGATVIRVEALRRMAALCKDIAIQERSNFYTTHKLPETIHLFFDPVFRPGLETLDEDYAFCQRWTDQCGGAIHALLDEVITHVGAAAFRGAVLAKWAADRQKG